MIYWYGLTLKIWLKLDFWVRLWILCVGGEGTGRGVRVYRVSQKKLGLVVLLVNHSKWDWIDHVIPFLNSAEPQLFKNGIICPNWWNARGLNVAKCQISWKKKVLHLLKLQNLTLWPQSYRFILTMFVLNFDKFSSWRILKVI